MNFKAVSFILCVSAITFIDVANGAGLVGGCQEMSAEDFEKSADAQAGVQKLKSILRAGVNCKPGYDPEVKLPDLKTCTQVVAGVNYKYTWTNEEYKCVNRNANGEAYVLNQKGVKCNASYWVKPWENFAQMNGPKCS